MKTMNNLTLLFLMFLLLSFESTANDDKYVQSMKKNIEALYMAAGVSDVEKSINAFERIGMAEKTKWEPYYYASYGYLMLALREAEVAKKDVYLDEAARALKLAQQLVKEESEVTALEGFIHMIRISVDPAARGQQYSGMAFQSLNKAVAQNNENPRALSLLAQMQYGTAQFFGSSTDEACTTLGQALEKFDSYKPSNPLAPTWGKPYAEQMMSQCK